MKNSFSLSCLLNLILFTCTSLLFNVINAQQIDSVVVTTAPYMNSGNPKISMGVDVYVSDTTNVNEVQLNVGYEEGSDELLAASNSAASLSVLRNETTEAFYYHIDAGTYNIVPPYVSARLSRRNGTLSESRSTQLVY